MKVMGFRECLRASHCVAAAVATMAAIGSAVSISPPAWAGETAAAAGQRAAASPPKGAPGNSSPSDAISAADLTVLQKLHDGNQMEIQMDHLAAAKGASTGLKEYGKQLVADHASSEKKLAGLLRQRGLSVTSLATTTSADPAHSGAADQVGVTFDRAFVAQTMKDHQKAIDLLENARRNTTDALVKNLYEDLLPMLRAHMEEAKRLLAGKGGA